MRELVAPAAGLHAAWSDCHREWGPGLHEDGFGLRAGDETTTGAGFAAWLARLAAEPCLYRWIVDDGRVLGGIAMRYETTDFVRRAGHIGYGIRPSARRRGLATWALGEILREAPARGLTRVLLVCEYDNEPSARAIEHHGGVREPDFDPEFDALRRYWITLTPQ